MALRAATNLLRVKLTGLLQSEGYARALLATLPGVSSETVAARLAHRMQRQRRVLMRDNPPAARFLVDELALYRRVGSAEVMAGQLRRLLELAAMPRIIVQVLPAIAHPVNASGFLMADDAVWIEHAAGGFTYTDARKPFRPWHCASIRFVLKATAPRSRQRSSRGSQKYGQLA